MITYKAISNSQKDTILTLYQSVKWTNYTDQPESLLLGIKNSLLVLGAFHNDTLIGLVRVVGDANTIIYIQDILIMPEYQGKGIGQELMKKILHKYAPVRQKVLLADSSEILDAFYTKIGFLPSLTQGLTCYVKLCA